MRRLTVLYDASCGFCFRCCEWLERQPQLVALDFVAARSVEAQARFPGLRPGAADELVAVSDDGGVYRGERAYILCLYALRDYRAWSYRFAEPSLRPFVRRAFDWLSQNRKDLSKLVGLASRGEVASGPACDGEGACGSSA